MFRRVLFPHLLFLLVLSASNAAGADANPRRKYYTEIPGVTREEIDAIERLKERRPEGLSYAMLYSDLSFVKLNGKFGGFSNLFCQEMAALFGMPITPKLVDWRVLVTGLDDHTFDLSGELTATPQRREKYRMTDSIMERVFGVSRRADRPVLDLINGGEALRLGFLEGSVTYSRVLNASAVPFTPIFVKNFREASEAIQAGTIDGFVSEGKMSSLFVNRADIEYQEYYPLVFTSVSLATANPDIYPIIDVFQKYLDNGGIDRMLALQDKGETEYLRHEFYLQLDDEERKYVIDRVRNGKVITLAAESDNYPSSFYNRRERAWQGIAHDILAEITRITDLEFQVVNKADAPWLEVQETLESGTAAMVTELMPTKNRRGKFLWPREPFTTDSYALLSLVDTPNIDIHRVFRSKVGVIRGSAHEEAFHQVFPDHPSTIAYPTAMAGFRALEKGEVDLVMMTRNLLLSITDYRERPGFKINIPMNLPSNSYFGFNRDEPMLCGIIGKAQGMVDCENIADQWKRKSFDYSKKIAQARIPYLISISVLVVIVLSLLLTLSRKKEFRSRRLSMFDHLTRLPNRRHFDERMCFEWEKAVKERLRLSLIAVDIDHFKRINDAYGHPKGDVVLRTVAEVLKKSTQRHTDMVARIGGEEFSVLLPNTDSDGARLVAERIRDDVAQTAIENLTGGPAINVTVSIGVASARPGPDNSAKSLESRSDEALYAAKQGGRNRVCVA